MDEPQETTEPCTGGSAPGPQGPDEAAGPVNGSERDSKGRFKPGNRISKAGGEAHRQSRQSRRRETGQGTENGSADPLARQALDREIARLGLLEVLDDKRGSARSQGLGGQVSGRVGASLG